MLHNIHIALNKKMYVYLRKHKREIINRGEHEVGKKKGNAPER